MSVEPALVINRPVLRYFGGKWRLAPWIISHFPPHITYVDTFGGGANVLIRKQPSPLEAYNDIDGDVVTFFRVLRERSAELAHAIQMTPYSREEYTRCCAGGGDDLERARKVYVRCWQSRGRPSQGRSAWSFRHTPSGTDRIAGFYDSNSLLSVAARFRHVQIEQDDFATIIRRFDTPATLFYVDPPYLPEVRSERRAYVCEMAPERHEELAEELYRVRGMAVVSGYPSPTYERLFRDRGWATVTTSSQTDAGTSRVEALWLNPAATAARPTLSLFGREEDPA